MKYSLAGEGIKSMATGIEVVNEFLREQVASIRHQAKIMTKYFLDEEVVALATVGAKPTVAYAMDGSMRTAAGFDASSRHETTQHDVSSLADDPAIMAAIIAAIKEFVSKPTVAPKTDDSAIIAAITAAVLEYEASSVGVSTTDDPAKTAAIIAAIKEFKKNKS